MTDMVLLLAQAVAAELLMGQAAWVYSTHQQEATGLSTCNVEMQGTSSDLLHCACWQIFIQSQDFQGFLSCQDHGQQFDAIALPMLRNQ